MNCRRLQNFFRCQRNRGKGHYQVGLEVLARLFGSSSLSSMLMVSSLERHGLGNEINLADILKHPNGRPANFQSNEALTGRFFIDPSDEEVWATYRSCFEDKIESAIKDAEMICRHEFRLLGSEITHSGELIDWHIDPISGYRWPRKLFSELKGAARIPGGSDIKLPWELSRMQHLPTLGKAYNLTHDERYAREIVNQLTHWFDDNPCSYGVNWTCAMDVAIRIMNIVWGYLLIKDEAVVTDEFRSRLAVSIYQHGQFILFNLESSLRTDGSVVNGNHYLTNVVGLLHLGLLCPELTAADQWKAIGTKALVEEMERQVHSDGGDFESSIAYHRLVLELFTAGGLLCRANGVSLPDRFWQRLEKMYEFVLFVNRPDGKAPVVGDADDGRLYILSDYGNWDRTDFCYLLSLGAVLFQRSDMKVHAGKFSEDAFWLLGIAGMDSFTALDCEERDLPSKAFPDSGLYVMRAGNEYLLACCGEVGTEGLGNHKHNDLLGFELYAGDKAFIVDPGTYVYTRNPEWRNLFRSTSFHNTVVIDDQEQNRFEPGRMFEMTADADVIVHEWVSTPYADRLDVEHTGYSRLDQPVYHRRKFVFHKAEGSWEIIDVIQGAGEHTADWYFHFDSGIELARAHDQMFRTCCEGTNLQLKAEANIPVVFQVGDGWVSRRYGRKLPSKVLHIRGKFNSGCRTVLTIQTV